MNQIKISDCNNCVRSCKKAFFKNIRHNCPYHAQPHNMRVSLLQHIISKNPNIVNELLQRSKLRLIDIRQYPKFDLIPVN